MISTSTIFFFFEQVLFLPVWSVWPLFVFSFVCQSYQLIIISQQCHLCFVRIKDDLVSIIYSVFCFRPSSTQDNPWRHCSQSLSGDVGKQLKLSSQLLQCNNYRLFSSSVINVAWCYAALLSLSVQLIPLLRLLQLVMWPLCTANQMTQDCWGAAIWDCPQGSMSGTKSLEKNWLLASKSNTPTENCEPPMLYFLR